MTSAVGSTSNTAGNSINNALASLANNSQTFLTLLTTQLKNQDPTSPLDTNQFTAQLTQMTGVEQQLLSNQLLQQMVSQSAGTNVASAVGLIGKQVSADGSSAVLNNGAATWNYTLGSNAANVTVQVTDVNGNVVYSGAAPTGAGKQSFSWNGQTTNGQQEPNGGFYTISITATNASGGAVTADTSVSGTATAVEEVGGQTMITVNGTQVPLTAVTSVNSSASGT
ncbi:MAG TPA: flagellar hook capping FlgD N-terminal domain-containing protein [Caulobacteraceae bacterium]|jgi:flagellar basal-body rod modification protein FlgD|nr:flagellar hook capping FlgD N-terminal domain-containing protein [Caulobacteraceae bacterium]